MYDVVERANEMHQVWMLWHAACAMPQDEEQTHGKLFVPCGSSEEPDRQHDIFIVSSR